VDILPTSAEFRQRGRALAREFARELGMPAGADWRRIWSHWPLSKANPESRLLVLADSEADSMVLNFESRFLRRWDGYALDLLGLVVEHGAPGNDPRWRVTLDTGEAITVQIWHVLAAATDVPAAAELRWSPTDGTSRRLLLLEEWEQLRAADQDKAVLSAARGMQAIRGLVRHGGGRPPGARKGRVWRRRDYLEWYREAGQGYARGGERLTLRDLGAAMGISDDTAGARLRNPEVNLPWPPEAYPEVWESDPEE